MDPSPGPLNVQKPLVIAPTIHFYKLIFLGNRSFLSQVSSGRVLVSQGDLNMASAIQVDGLSITAKKKPPKVFITIQGATTVNRLQTRASPGQSPRRESNLSMCVPPSFCVWFPLTFWFSEIRDLSTVTSFLVYRRRWWFLKDRIGGVDCPFSHFATPGLTGAHPGFSYIDKSFDQNGAQKLRCLLLAPPVLWLYSIRPT